MLLKDAQVIIAGAGPCGLLMAAMLHAQGVPCIVLEKDTTNKNLDVSRAYTQTTFYRGRRVLAQIPALYDAIAKRASHHILDSHSLLIPAEGDVVTRVAPIQTPDGKRDFRLFREGLIKVMREYVSSCGVEIKMGAQVVAVDIQSTDDICVSVEVGNQTETLTTRLLIACDGCNSVVVQELQRLHSEGKVSSSNNFDSITYNSPSVGLCRKTMVLNADFATHIKPQIEAKPDSTYVFQGQRRNRGRKSVWTSVVFPLHPEDVSLVGGYYSSAVVTGDHELLKAKTVEEGYRIYEENFPQLDVRKCVSRENMETFLTSQPSQYGIIRRCKSLVAHAGGSGIVLLGDAAHSFPPDLGQGVNSAFEDVGLLAKIFKECTTIPESLRRYEAERTADVSALLRAMRFGYPYMFQQSRRGLFLWRLNSRMRRRLSKWFPGVFYPQIASMITSELSYKEIMRRADTSTRRIWGLSALAIIPAFVFLSCRLLKKKA